MNEDLQDIEVLLRESRPPDREFTQRERLKAWSNLVAQQRRRRREWKLLGLPAWGWAWLSVTFIILCILVMYFLN